MKKTLLLVDGHALAFRSYYALERTGMRTSEKQPTWAVYGFFKAIFDILKNQKIKPDAIAVAFDVGRQTFRLEHYGEYKANRAVMPDELHSQIGLIIEGLQAFNIPIFTKAGYEADDVIGTIATRAAKLGHRTLILTGDQDSFQLIDEQGDCVRVLIPSKGELVEYDCQKVYDKLLVYPSQIIDYKALRGDTSDNIPGIKGIGEKTAQKLLGNYKTLDGIYENIENIKEKALKKKLEEGVEIARLSQFLATIDTNVDIDFDFEKTKLEIADLKKVNDFLKKVQFYSFLKNINSILAPFINGGTIVAEEKNEQQSEIKQLGFFDVNPNIIKESADVKNPLMTEKNIVDDEEKFKKLVELLKQHKVFALDIQTSEDNFMNADIVGICVALNHCLEVKESKICLNQCENKTQSYYIPLFHSVGRQLDFEQVISELKPFFENEKISKCLHNAKNALNYFRKTGISLRGVVFDTMLAAYVSDPARNQELNFQALENLDFIIKDKESLIGKGKQQISFSSVEIEAAADFACDNATVILELTKYWSKKLSQNELKLLYEMELPLTYVLADMEFQGVSIDVAYLKKISAELNQSLSECENEIYQMAGEAFNINSPKKVGEILFEKLNLKSKGKKKTKTGFSTSAKVLEELAEDNEIVAKILEHRHLVKLKTTYVDALPELISSQDDRIHTTFNQTITLTGRLSSSNPNLQNIPIRTQLGNRIRGAFVPKNKEKSVIVSADYSQIELRLLAHISDDKNMIEAINSSVDIHSLTASKVFNVATTDVTKQMRSAAKAVNFGIVYGQTKYGLAKSLNISADEAQNFIDKYFEVYPNVKKYMETTKDFANINGYVETMFGRRRYLQEELNNSNFQIREFAQRAAINQPIQGSASDLIKIAMINLHKRLLASNLEAKMLLQVHDELILEVDKKDLDTVKKIVIEEMQLKQPLKVPLEIDFQAGESWMEGE